MSSIICHRQAGEQKNLAGIVYESRGLRKRETNGITTSLRPKPENWGPLEEVLVSRCHGTRSTEEKGCSQRLWARRDISVLPLLHYQPALHLHQELGERGHIKEQAA